MRAGSKNLHARLIEFHHQVIGSLSSSRNHHALGLFQFINVQNAFQRKLIEIEFVAHIVIRGHGLGIVVDHNRLVLVLLQRLHRVYTAPVKFNRGANTVSPTAEYNGSISLSAKFHIIFSPVIGHIQVVGLSWILGRERIDLFNHRQHLEFFAQRANLHFFFAADDANLFIGEAVFFRAAK